ncbi:PREDICTED: exportin-T-like isoform X3 [Amphimedon queenslandica]|uniref:Exportin-T n=2 Tax=Amphimedon queenslandica TaxID=400682 RepID=A0AAN0JHR0_AMPQE|nr:PREDICTED: exportin-T-like isoform X3 [Amphimedon queenslandica]|eukprot:XP_019856331.1 PREDICTED: exportin-T-like isoform X3 [Amphimedon queenslandica]
MSPFLSQVFTPIVERIISCINRPMEPDDNEEYRDKLNLHKSYYLFINSICINGVTEVIASQNMEQVNSVLGSIVEGASTSPDSSVKRICFMSLKKLVEGWSGQNVLLDYPSTSGFIDYVYKEILPICFVVPLQPTFDLNEGQAYLCLGEIVSLLKELVTQRGEEFLLYLQSQYLPSLMIPTDIGQEMSVRLQENDMKSLKIYFKALFTSLRTSPTQRS